MWHLRLLGILGVLTLLGGCPRFGHYDDKDTYCDSTGCYYCDDWGGCYLDDHDCRSSWECEAGYLCQTGVCLPSTTCATSADCTGGRVCDSRSTCVAPPRGAACTTDAACGDAAFCDLRAGVCIPTASCHTDWDCGGVGWVCDARDTCVPQPCTTSAECEQGCYCANGMCIETMTCRGDNDCIAGLTCDEPRRTCIPDDKVPPPPPPPECTMDSQCPGNQACFNGACTPGGVSMPELTCESDRQCGTGKCIPNAVGQGLCHRLCDENDDCGTGDVCPLLPDAATAYCDKNQNPTIACIQNADCGGLDKTCINGTCHQNCTSDASCKDHNPADFCDQGICRPDWRAQDHIQCALDVECSGANQQCVNGSCQTRCLAEADCATSPNGPACVMGYCAPTP